MASRLAERAAPVAYLFPTFPFRHRTFTHDRLPGYAALVGEFALRAAHVVPIAPATFVHPDPAVPPPSPEAALEATLQAQYACYIENVAMGRWLEQRFPPASFTAGYSMGVFSAACHAGAIDFEDGLSLVHSVCVNAHAAAPPGAFAIGAVIGMTRDDVSTLIQRLPDAALEITDVYSEHIVLVTGRAEEIMRVLDAASRAGAPDTRFTPFSAPFHSSALAPVEAMTGALTAAMTIAAPRVPIVSAVTQEFLRDAGGVRAELARNVSHGMNWYATIRALLDAGTALLLECGTSTHLTNLIREDVPGACPAQDFRDFEQLAGSAS